MSFLTTIGADVKAVFSWLGSSKGQAIVQTVEGATEAVGTALGAGPAITAAFNLVNTWGAEIIKTETIAAAAGESTGSSAQKAAAALSTMVPQLTTFLQSQGLTSQQITDKANTINTALVTVLNALEVPATTPTTEVKS